MLNCLNAVPIVFPGEQTAALGYRRVGNVKERRKPLEDVQGPDLTDLVDPMVLESKRSPKFWLVPNRSHHLKAWGLWTSIKQA